MKKINPEKVKLNKLHGEAFTPSSTLKNAVKMLNRIAELSEEGSDRKWVLNMYRHHIPKLVTAIHTFRESDFVDEELRGATCSNIQETFASITSCNRDIEMLIAFKNVMMSREGS